MAGGSDNEKHLDATAKKLSDARGQGDVPMSRESGIAGGYFAALLAIAFLGGSTARKIGELLLPMLDQPEAFPDLTQGGLQMAGQAVFTAIAIAILPVFGMLVAGAILPHVLQNSVVFSTVRVTPKLSNFSLSRGFSKLFSFKAIIEFGKSLVKMAIIGFSCYMIARPLYNQSANLIGMDIRALLPLVLKSLVSLMTVITVFSVVMAGIDIPYQHWSYRRKHRMSLEDIKDEQKDADGDPRIKSRLRRIRRERARRRMMQDVKKASVVITNPTHYAVALRYERGVDAAPVVLAKGLDLVAQNIKKEARDHNVPIMEDRPLARALYASVEIGETIPRDHFEAVAKIIGLIWAQKGEITAPS